MNNIQLNNGMIAKFQYIDSFSRQVYKLDSGTILCSVDLDGTNLHTISEDGEPCTRAKKEFQPKGML